jgi:hypothetical protein
MSVQGPLVEQVNRTVWVACISGKFDYAWTYFGIGTRAPGLTEEISMSALYCTIIEETYDSLSVCVIAVLPCERRYRHGIMRANLTRWWFQQNCGM